MDINGNDTDETLNGSNAADKIDGKGGDDKLFGLEGNDVLTGGLGNDELQGGLGNDQMIGGLGNDVYWLDSAGDKVTEKANEGVDTIHAAFAKYTLAAQVENLVMEDGALEATGNSLDNTIGGSSAANLIDGSAGNDDLSGGFGNDTLLGGAGNDILDGGAGTDALKGGAGDDIYKIDSLEDTIVEAANQGSDTIKASFISDQTLDLNTFANVENVEILGAAKITVIGNALGNRIIGNFNNETFEGRDGNDTLAGGGGNDTLDGGAGDDVLNGGSGFNTLRGGVGNDTYVLEVALMDTIVENANEGVDEIRANFSIKLDGALANIENLVMTGPGILKAEGNDLDNKIVANNAGNVMLGYLGNDLLIGGIGDDNLNGGVGKDVMAGGAGNDFYVVDDAGDKITEKAGEGYDTVSTTLASYVLGSTFEVLASAVTTGTFKGTGNASGNELYGNKADDTLLGLGGGDYINGGDGNDTLDGGAGNDELVGRDGDDLLIGGAGNDSLDGGDGKNEMRGGAGDDSYQLDGEDDVVIEKAGEGIDSIEGAFSIDLNDAKYKNIENAGLSGAGNFKLTGNAGDNWLAGNDGSNEIQGGKGDDLIVGMEGDDKILGGAGDDYLSGDSWFGGDGDDLLDGGDGNDILVGNGGSNLLVGGAGNDTYVLDKEAADAIDEKAGEGIDELRINTTSDLRFWDFVENLTLVGDDKMNGYGTNDANVIRGGGGDNELYGNDGDDTLIGGGGADLLYGGIGADTMIGGTGNDIYIVDEAKDKVVEAKNEGYDTAKSYLMAYTLGANVEALRLLTGALDGTGNELGNTLTGNDMNNKLAGLAGNDWLDGGYGNDTLDGGAGDDFIAGGEGADKMIGGAGNDHYLVDADDTVIEAKNGGIDEVRTELTTYTLGANLEILTSAATGPVVFTGNDLDNAISGQGSLSGGLGNDTLSGSDSDDTLDGGAGNDILYGHKGSNTLDGGAGNDIYVITNAATNTIQDSGGIDEVRVDGDYTLADNLENLTLTQAGMTTNVGKGNALANVITGSEGSDHLEGLGGNDILKGGDERDFLYGGEGNDQLFGGDGNDDLSGEAGNDVLTGGKGDDTYGILDVNDKVVETAGEGFDSVVSYLEGYTLAANVEYLVLGGTIAKGSGNAGDNVLDGNNVANQLDGAAGDDAIYGKDGDDALTGGAGNDWVMGGNGADTINGGTGDDFLSGDLGADTLTGGAGKDRFYYAVDQLTDLANLGGDKITDFEVGKDKLELGVLFSEFDVDSEDPVGDGFIKFEVNGKDTKVLFDADGGGDDYLTLVTLVGVTKASFADVSLEA